MPLLTAYLVIRTPRGNERRVSAFIPELYHTPTNRSLFTRKSEEPDFGEYLIVHDPPYHLGGGHFLDIVAIASDGSGRQVLRHLRHRQVA